MLCNMESLCRKDVINVCNGCRIGFVRDINMDTATACILALLVEPDCGFSFKKKNRTVVVPWDCVQVIGDATVLVRCETQPQPCEKEKGKLLGSLLGR